MKRNIMTLVVVLIALVISHLAISQLSFAGEATKPITLRTSVYFAPNSFQGKLNQWWADELARRTNGRVKIEFFWMDSLVKQIDMLPGLKARMTDLGFLGSSYHPSNLPVFNIIDLCGNAGTDSAAIILASLETQENEPHMKAELERENIIMLAEHLTGFGGFGMGKRYSSLADLKGKTMRSVGGVRNTYLKELGINPIFMPYTDVYEAMSRGTVDGFTLSYPLSHSMKHYDVIKSVVVALWGQLTTAGIVTRRDLFLKLPKDIQKIMLDLRTDFVPRYAQAVDDDIARVIQSWIFEHGINFIALTPEEQALNAKARVTANEVYLKDKESKGVKGVRAAWDYYLKALKRITDERAKARKP